MEFKIPTSNAVSIVNSRNVVSSRKMFDNTVFSRDADNFFVYVDFGWRLGVVVSVVGHINEVNQHRARLVHDG